MRQTAYRRNGWSGVVAAVLLLVGLAPPAVQAQAAPANRLRVLFLGDDRLHQPSVRAKEILPVMAHNGVDMFYTDDPNDLSTDLLNDFHALIFYNNQPSISQDQLRALLGFVENGGGLVVLHAGSASFQNSEEFIRLVGGAFMSHGTGTFTAARVAPEHPAIRGVPTIESWDETYVHTKHNPVNRTVLEVRREGGHEEPWTWVRTYGAGRVFYTAWGHDARTWSNEGFQQLVVQGTRWAAGDWGLAARPDAPEPPKERLEVPLPTYVQGAPWNTLGPPIWEAQVPLPIEESFALTTLRPGFSLHAFATEPMIGRIIDFTWDEAGRMWAVETNDYPNRLLPDTVPGGDRILILQDTDADGLADDVKVFADGLNLATSLVLINGGVVVAQAPHFFFMKDTDGDDRADVKDLIMTGWPRNDTHGTPSNFRYNFDNQILASVGYNGFRGEVGGRTWGPGEFFAGYFRFTPDGASLDYLARTSNNTWGVALSEDGYIFGSTANGRPSTFVHIPARYYRTLNLSAPILPGIEDRQDIFPLTSIMQVDWFGMYTSGAAHELYTAREFPREYWNRKAFVVDPTGNLVGMFDLRRNGTAFSAKNEWSFLASRDPWVAPVQVKVGPDGALWVSDFYSLVAQHNPFVEMEGCCPRGEGNAYETPNRDAAHARIYRVVYDGAPPQTPMRLDGATPAQLVAALSDDNMFWRLTAQRLLVERGTTEVVPALIDLVNDHTIDELGLNNPGLHALWTLHGLGALENNVAARAAVANALHHPAASLRRAALMALPRDQQLENAIFAAGLLPDRNAPGASTVGSGTLQDAHHSVRMEALLVLSELPPSERAAAAIREVMMVAQNGRDRWMPDAVAIAAARQTPDLALELLRTPPVATDSAYLVGARTVVQFLARYHASNQDIGRVIALLEAVPEADPILAEGVFAGIAGAAQGSPPFRADWRGDQAGWPEDQRPTLTAEQRATITAAARASAPDAAAGFARVAARWGMPELVQ
jgi:uncharacterized protein